MPFSFHLTPSLPPYTRISTLHWPRHVTPVYCLNVCFNLSPLPDAVITRGCATRDDLELYLPNNEDRWEKLLDPEKRNGFCKNVKPRDDAQERPDRGDNGEICFCNFDDCNHGNVVQGSVLSVMLSLLIGIPHFYLQG